MFVSALNAARRSPLLSISVLAILVQPVLGATPARSQGFFQQLLGLYAAPQASHRPRQSVPQHPVGSSPLRWHIAPSPDRRGDARRSAASDGSGSYTTVCVRMCDGYYFPISHRASRSRFYNDAEACRSRCAHSDAKLFYFPASGGSMKSAVDLTGRAYARLPIAFMHRKRIVDGCGCRPEPWSVAALIRHEGYAIAEGRAVPGSQRTAGAFSVVAGSYSDKPSTPPIEPEAREVAHNQEQQPGDAPPAAADAAEPPKPLTAEMPAPDQPLRKASSERKPQRATSQRSAGGTAAPRRMQSARVAGFQAPRKSPNVAVASAGRMVWPGDQR